MRGARGCLIEARSVGDTATPAPWKEEGEVRLWEERTPHSLFPSTLRFPAAISPYLKLTRGLWETPLASEESELRDAVLSGHTSRSQQDRECWKMNLGQG